MFGHLRAVWKLGFTFHYVNFAQHIPRKTVPGPLTLPLETVSGKLKAAVKKSFRKCLGGNHG